MLVEDPSHALLSIEQLHFQRFELTVKFLRDGLDLFAILGFHHHNRLLRLSLFLLHSRRTLIFDDPFLKLPFLPLPEYLLSQWLTLLLQLDHPQSQGLALLLELFDDPQVIVKVGLESLRILLSGSQLLLQRLLHIITVLKFGNHWAIPIYISSR